MTNVVPFIKYVDQQTLDREQLKRNMLIALKIVEQGSAFTHELPQIAATYMFQDDGIVWPLLQALAYNGATPAYILRELHAKRRWYLDMGLAHNISTPHDVLEVMAHAPIEKTSNLKDKNEEIRAITRRRLSMPAFVRPTDNGYGN